MSELWKKVIYGKNNTRSILAYAYSLFAMIYIWHVSTHEIHEKSIRIVDTILGFLLGTIIATVINYYYGSSQGSADKNEMIKNDGN